MLKREVTYEDFNGDTVTEAFYFNISKAELIELETEYDEGLGAMLQRIVKAENNNALIREFKRLVLIAYGEKSEDGKRFIKSDQMREEFSQTAAYQKLFMEMVEDDNAAVNFFRGVLPKDMVGDFDKAVEETRDPTVEEPVKAPVAPTSRTNG